MLQLPSPSPRRPRFSRAELAEISRGAVIKPTRSRARPDYIVKRLSAFEAALEQFIAVEKVLEEARTALEPHNACVPCIRPLDLSPPVRAISGPFYSEKNIRNAIRDYRRSLIESRKRDRSRRNVERSQIQKLECEQRIASYNSLLGDLDGIEHTLLRAMRKEIARVKKLQRALYFEQKESAWFRTHTEMWKAFHALHWRKVATSKGALAILRLTKIILETSVLSSVAARQMIEHAHLILATDKGDA